MANITMNHLAMEMAISGVKNKSSDTEKLFLGYGEKYYKKIAKKLAKITGFEVPDGKLVYGYANKAPGYFNKKIRDAFIFTDDAMCYYSDADIPSPVTIIIKYADINRMNVDKKYYLLVELKNKTVYQMDSIRAHMFCEILDEVRKLS